MIFALCLCALIAYQWHRETRSNKRIQDLLDLDHGNKEQIQTAFNELGKNGCGGCHGKFREELKK